MAQNHNMDMKITADISQNMLFALQLLQMDSLALEEYLAKQLDENPILERLEQKMPATSIPHGTTIDSTVLAQTIGQNDPLDTLSFYLTDQLSRLHLDQELKKLCAVLVQLMDEYGYLSPADLDALPVSHKILEQALDILHRLDPPGVAARDLRECLLLQLQRQQEDTSLAELLVQEHLQAVADRKYQKLSDTLNKPLATIESAVASIRALDPRPGHAFTAKDERAHYTRPDFLVTVEGSTVICQRRLESFPRVGVQQFYQNLYQSTEDSSVKGFLRNYIGRANQLIAGLDRREHTVDRCAQIIVEIQRDFFLTKTGVLAPLDLRILADRLGVHESTVSRSINGKYLEFDRKLYPLKFFFAQAAAGSFVSDVSVQQVKRLIEEMIQNEAENVLSDQDIADILKQGGFSISRRTVAKYREELGLPTSHIRKREKRGQERT